MELIIAIVLFVGVVGSWLVLPSVPPAEKSGHGVPAAAPSKA
jgi:hypothetical protein